MLGEQAADIAACFSYLSKTDMDKLFKPATLTIPAESAKDQRWYITYWPFSVRQSRHIRRRVYNLPDLIDASKKEKECIELCKRLDRLIRNGMVVKEKPSLKSAPRFINHYMDEYLDTLQNKKERSIKAITGSLNKFRKFLVKNGYQYYIPIDFDSSHVLKYRNSLIKSGLKNRSINNDMAYAKTFFFYIVHMYPNHVDKNPFSLIKTLSVENKRNTAYLPHQVEALLEVQKQVPDLDFIAKFMYYTCIRTNEMSQLRIKQIGMYHPNQIYIPKEHSKTSKERHVHIPEALERLFEKFGVRDYPEDYYLFSFEPSGKYKVRGTFKPGPKKHDYRYFGQKYRQQVLSKLNYSNDYTLYSWKHTGVISAKRAGVSDADIMQQTGHVNYSSYLTYLKSLGLFANGEYAAKIPEI